MKEIYTSPLSIYVVWHPDFKRGQEIADKIYSNFSRDTNSPLSRGIGIPVYYRSKPIKGSPTPKAIPIEKSDYNAIVVLIDDYLFNDDKWNSFVKNLIKKTDGKTRIFPIAFSSNAFYFEESTLGKEQFIDAKPDKINYLEKEFEKKQRLIYSRLLHDFCRLLLNKNPFYDAEKEIKPPAKVSLFISHAKHDGETEAKNFRDYVRKTTKLNTFFDVNDIADGYRFDTQIEDAVMDGNSALVVFHSDAYAAREWCQIEVLTAKRFKSPIVLVHNITRGEKRSFPYLGNIPTIKFLNDNFEDIIDLTLFQVLINIFHKLNLEKVTKLFVGKDKNMFELLSTPPELVNFRDLLTIKAEKASGKSFSVIYPDPPLGNAELKVLEEMKSSMRFLTPIQLSALIK